MQNFSALPAEIKNTKFDNIICMGNSLGGIFTEEEQNGFAVTCRSLARNGSCLFVDRYDVSRYNWPDTFALFNAKDKNNRGYGILTMESWNRTLLYEISHYFAQYYPSRNEVISLFTKEGFKLISSLYVERSKDHFESKEYFVFEFQPYKGLKTRKLTSATR